MVVIQFEREHLFLKFERTIILVGDFKMLSKVYILDEKGLQAILILGKNPRIKVTFSDEDIPLGSALAAYLLKMSSEQGLLPFMRFKENFLFYVKDYMFVGVLEETTKESIKKGFEFLHRLNEFLRERKINDLDGLINALIEFLRGMTK